MCVIKRWLDHGNLHIKMKRSRPDLRFWVATCKLGIVTIKFTGNRSHLCPVSIIYWSILVFSMKFAGIIDLNFEVFNIPSKVHWKCMVSKLSSNEYAVFGIQIYCLLLLGAPRVKFLNFRRRQFLPNWSEQQLLKPFGGHFGLRGFLKGCCRS